MQLVNKIHNVAFWVWVIDLFPFAVLFLTFQSKRTTSAIIFVMQRDFRMKL